MGQQFTCLSVFCDSGISQCFSLLCLSYDINIINDSEIIGNEFLCVTKQSLHLG